MDKGVKQRFDVYPKAIKDYMLSLRILILDVAKLLEQPVEETLKWGEPSYLVKSGSTVRMDWKEVTPHHCYLYFNCNTKLVDTFRELYSDELKFEGNRAIVLDTSEAIHETIIRHCISLSFNYKK